LPRSLEINNPKRIKIVSEFPMTVTGKMQKFIMRDQYAEELSVF
jgi:fatty-acyl-CoA synthase